MTRAIMLLMLLELAAICAVLYSGFKRLAFMDELIRRQTTLEMRQDKLQLRNDQVMTYIGSTIDRFDAKEARHAK